MTIKQMVACLAMLAIFVVGGAGMAVAQDSHKTGAKATLNAPDVDSLEPGAKPDKEDAGPCCHTRGVPECGGSCEICCKLDQQASCVAGGCDPDNTFACTCTVVTSCSCK